MTYYKYDNNTIKAIERFNSKFEKKDSGCWEWIAFRDADGYGQFTLNVPGKKHMLRAHRFSWIIANKQDWPTDKPVARHLCNNPCCVNSEHITPGTVSENTIDSINAGTFVKNYGARKPVMTPLGEFESGQKAARALGISHQTLIEWMKTKPTQYYKTKE